MTEQQNSLLEKVKHDVKDWDPKRLPDPILANNLPRILFWHIGYEKDPFQMEQKYFREDCLNKNEELVHFTDWPFEAINSSYRIRRAEVPGNFLNILFPHETSDLSRWVVDQNALTKVPGPRVFVTDQGIKSTDLLLVAYTQVITPGKHILGDQFPGRTKAALLPELQTRECIMEYFGLTEQNQRALFDIIRI